MKAGFTLKILKLNALTDEQTQKIRALEEACIAQDKLETRLFLSTEINYDRNIPVFFPAFDGDELVGFLTVFIPTREEAEISALVRPDCRRRGIFTALDAAAREVIAENGIDRTLYCVQEGLDAAGAVLLREGISEIQRSEYRMTLKTSALPAAAPDESLRAVRVTAENTADYALISDEVYGDDSANHIDAITNSPTRFGYILYAGSLPVGVFTIGTEERDPFIYGVAVAERERGKGYGKRLMKIACRIAAEYGDTLQLEVDSENPRAFHIYKAIGFETAVRIDYYMR